MRFLEAVCAGVCATLLVMAFGEIVGKTPGSVPNWIRERVNAKIAADERSAAALVELVAVEKERAVCEGSISDYLWELGPMFKHTVIATTAAPHPGDVFCADHPEACR